MRILAPITISPNPPIASAIRPNFSPMKRPIRMPVVAIKKVAHPIARAVTTMSPSMKAKVGPTAIASMLVPMAVATSIFREWRFGLHRASRPRALSQIICAYGSEQSESDPVIYRGDIAACGETGRPAHHGRDRLDGAEHNARAQGF